MNHRPTFDELRELSTNDLTRLRLMADHLLQKRREDKIRPHVTSTSTARRLARQMTDAQVKAKLETLK